MSTAVNNFFLLLFAQAHLEALPGLVLERLAANKQRQVQAKT